MPINYIPNGPKNLASLFPAINWSNVKEYFIEALDADGNVIATTCKNLIQCCCGEDKIRIHFLNYCGTLDAINFQKPSISHETSFSEFKKTLPDNFSKPDTGGERFDIKANDLYTAKTSCYCEEQMLWMQELADNSKAFLEWKGVQGQADSYLPITITMKKFDKKKNINDFRYDFIVEFKLSNEYLTIRN